MYDVLFTPEKCSYQARIFHSDNFACAIEFALQLHSASNVAHEVIVFDNSTDEVRLSLV